MANKSIFEIIAGGNFAKFIESRQDRLQQSIYREYMPFDTPQLSLTYTSVLGKNEAAAVASVVSRDAETPLRTRDVLSALQGDIPAIKVMRKLDETSYREYMALSSMNVSDTIKRDQVLNLIWNDTAYVVDSVEKRLEVFFAQGLSTGKITIDANTNPDGIVLPEINLLQPAENVVEAAAKWDGASAKPLGDIQKVVALAQAKGIVFNEILMSTEAFQNFIKAEEVASIFSGIAIISNARVNEFMAENSLPTIRVVNFSTQVQKDGKNTIYNPWEKSAVVFLPEGDLGTIKNAIAVEQMKPVTGIEYAEADRTLVSKWSKNEPFGEWTKAELNAFPSFEAMDSIYRINAKLS